MPFVISEPEDEQIEEESGFAIEEQDEGPPQGALKEQLFSPQSGIAQINRQLANAPSYALDAIMQLFGGTVQRENEEGLMEESNLNELFQDVTGGAYIPQSESEESIAKIIKTGSEFPAFAAGLPGAGAAIGAEGLGSFLGKEALTGAKFGAGEAGAEALGFDTVGQLLGGTALAFGPGILKATKTGFNTLIDYGKSLLKANEIPTGTPEFFKSIGPAAEADLALSQKNLAGRIAKTSENALEDFNKVVGESSDEVFRNLSDYNVSEIEQSIVNQNKNSILDTITTAPKTKKEAFEGIIEVMDNNFEAAKAGYSSLYEAAEKGASRLVIPAENTLSKAKELRTALNKTLLAIPEESKVRGPISTLIGQLEQIIIDESGKPVKITRPVNVQKLMATKRTINNILSKSDIIPAPVDLLKPLTKTLKEDIQAGLASRPNILRAYEAAENQFAKAQDVFNNKEILSARKSGNPEELGSFVSKPSNLQKMQEALGNDKQAKDLLERLAVDNITSKSKDAARELANESRQYLSNKSNQAMDRIIEYGDNLTNRGQQEIARGRILNDIQSTISTGKKPKATLDLMLTPTGYNLVKDTMMRSPKGKKIFKGLEKMLFEDMVASTIDKNGAINFEKAKDILKSPHMKGVIRDSLGESGYEFFNKLESYGKNMAENLNNLAVKDPNLLDKLLEDYMTKTSVKSALVAMAPFTKGTSLLPFALREGVTRVSRAKLFKTLENPEAQSLIKQLGNKRLSEKQTYNLTKKLSQIIGSS